jgi:hypothetical protein
LFVCLFVCLLVCLTNRTSNARFGLVSLRDIAKRCSKGVVRPPTCARPKPDCLLSTRPAHSVPANSKASRAQPVVSSQSIFCFAPAGSKFSQSIILVVNDVPKESNFLRCDDHKSSAEMNAKDCSTSAWLEFHAMRRVVGWEGHALVEKSGVKGVPGTYAKMQREFQFSLSLSLPLCVHMYMYRNMCIYVVCSHTCTYPYRNVAESHRLRRPALRPLVRGSVRQACLLAPLPSSAHVHIAMSH